MRCLKLLEQRLMARDIDHQISVAHICIAGMNGYLPFSASGGAFLFSLPIKLYERTRMVTATNLSVSEWAAIFGDAKMTIALLAPLTHRCHILETENDSFRIKINTAAVARKRKKPSDVGAPA